MFSEPSALAHTESPGACGSCFNLEGEEKILDLRSTPCAEHPSARGRFLSALYFKGAGSGLEMLQSEGSSSKGFISSYSTSSLRPCKAQNPRAAAAAQVLIVILLGTSGLAAVSHGEIRQQGSRTEGKEESGLPSA